jgi:hypothetical protein
MPAQRRQLCQWPKRTHGTPSPIGTPVHSCPMSTTTPVCSPKQCSVNAAWWTSANLGTCRFSNNICAQCSLSALDIVGSSVTNTYARIRSDSETAIGARRERGGDGERGPDREGEVVRGPYSVWVGGWETERAQQTGKPSSSGSGSSAAVIALSLHQNHVTMCMYRVPVHRHPREAFTIA